jgi:hypothetical protein
MEWQHATQVRTKVKKLWQEEDVRLSVLAVELEAAQKEIVEARKKLQADVDVALETSAANEKLRAELLARERQLDKHEEALKEWRATIKADVGAQVAEQEAILQVCGSSALAILRVYVLAQHRSPIVKTPTSTSYRPFSVELLYRLGTAGVDVNICKYLYATYPTSPVFLRLLFDMVPPHSDTVDTLYRQAFQGFIAISSLSRHLVDRPRCPMHHRLSMDHRGWGAAGRDSLIPHHMSTPKEHSILPLLYLLTPFHEQFLFWSTDDVAGLHDLQCGSFLLEK